MSGGSLASIDEGAISGQSVIGPLAASVLDISVPTLNYTRFNELSALQVPLLSLQQVASIPNSYWLGTMSTEARAALSYQQVRALQPAAVALNLLTPQQTSWLTTPQIQELKFWEFPHLSAAQVPLLTAAQIATINNTEALSAWSPSARAALTQSQVAALNAATVSIRLLTSQQIGWLTTAQIQSIPFYDIVYLQPGQIHQLSNAQIWSIPNIDALAAWSPASRAALTTSQVQSLSMPLTQVNLLNATQIGWLRPLQVQTVPFYGLRHLATAQIPWLTTEQVASINNTETLGTWSAAARAALTQSQVPALNVANVSIRLLTPQQISWLTTAQIQATPFYDFVYLSPSQIPMLTESQIESLPNTAALAAISAPARAALTSAQIQALQPSVVAAQLLTNQQVSWLSATQVRALNFWDFPRLSASHAALLTYNQVASIPNTDAFALWPPSTRAGLTLAQVRALDVRSISIGLLTSAQVLWLSDAQIQAIPFYDIVHLQSTQIPQLTTAQIGSIPSSLSLQTWSAASRAALTQVQIQALAMPSSRLHWMTGQQVSWLTHTQLRQVAFYDFTYLQPSQISLLSPQQFAPITTANVLRALSDPQQLALTRAQLLSLPTSVYSAYAHLSDAIAPPEQYQPVVNTPLGSNGVNSTPHTDVEWSRVMALVPTSAVTHWTVGSGNWSDPAIWYGGVVPRAGANVLIVPGHVVRFDAWLENFAINTLRIDGTLNFATNRGTQLKADTIVVNTGGVLTIGTASAPVGNDVAARVLIADNGPINTTKDPYMLGRGLLSRGRVEMYGKTVTPYVNLASNAGAGATTLTLAAAPVNWSVGDELVIAGTDPYVAHFRTDRVQIRAISGTTVTIDPLLYNHEVPAGLGLSIQVANLTRNVRFLAENSSVTAERPHIAFMHNPNVKIDNIGVYGFGRTDKDVRINDPVVVNGVLQPGTGTNPRARYAVHFHHTGVNPSVAPAVIRGSLVVDSPGWGFVNHQSNVVMENNVAYFVLGASFVTEDGNEIGLMRGNLALQTRGSLKPGDRREIHDFGFAGHGFWFQGPGVAVIDNISAGSQNAGFFYLTASSKVQFDAVNLSNPALAGGRLVVPVRSVPLNTFAGNTAYAGGDGLAIWNSNLLMSDGQTVIDRFTSWSTRENGIFIAYSGQVHVKDAFLVGNLQSFVGNGIATNRWAHDVVISNVRALGFQVGIVPTVRRSTTITGGVVAAVQGVWIVKGQDAIRTLNLRSTSFVDLNAAQLQGRRQYDVFASVFGPDEGNDRSPDSLFSSDFIVVQPAGSVAGKFYFYEQSASGIPFPSSRAAGLVPTSYLDKTAQQLRLEFGLSFGGEIAPSRLAQLPDVFGLMRYRF